MNSVVNGSTHMASTPSPATSSALRSIAVRIAGCEPGRITSAGCGSKVSSRQGRRIAWARVTAAPISCWWPRWSPSYIPMVTTVRPTSPGVASSPRQRLTVPAPPGRPSALPGKSSAPPTPPSADPVQPAVGVGHPAVLDVEEALPKLHRERPGGAVTDDEVTGAGPPLADRRDDGGGAAGEGLGDRAVGHALAPLLHAELPLGHRVALLAGQGDER